MERVLLLASLVVGVIVFFGRFLPIARAGGGPIIGTDSSVPHPTLRLLALITPLLGFLVTLPTHGAFFSEGQRLGFGFLIGGVAMLLANIHLLMPSRDEAQEPHPAVALASSYGMSIVAVTLALFLLRQSIFDGLMGVAIGGFSVAFALLLALPRAARVGAIGRRMAANIGLLVTLAAAASLGVFHDPLTPELPKLTWSAVLVAFTAFGTLLAAGTGLLPVERVGRYGRLMPLSVLIGVGGLALYEMATKITSTVALSLLGIGGLLLWPVALAVLRETARRGGQSATPLLSVPLLAVVVVTTGFLAALQTLQGVGVAVGMLALYLALPATFALMPSLGSDVTAEEGETTVPTAAVGLLLFGTLLLLWRLFVTRWTDDLRGVNLSDQYALFGLIVGAALPGLLSTLPARWRGGTEAKAAMGLWSLAVSAVLALAAPAVVLTLFGAKSAVALLIGLALGAVPTLIGGTSASLLPGLLALAVALALDQWTGTVLPDEAPTRVVKIRYLAGLMAVIIVLVIAADRIGAKSSSDAKETGDLS